MTLFGKIEMLREHHEADKTDADRGDALMIIELLEDVYDETLKFREMPFGDDAWRLQKCKVDASLMAVEAMDFRC